MIAERSPSNEVLSSAYSCNASLKLGRENGSYCLLAHGKEVNTVILILITYVHDASARLLHIITSLSLVF